MLGCRVTPLLLASSLLITPCHGMSAAWRSYCAFNADVAWRGYATIVDPDTAIPQLPGKEYNHFVAADEGGAAAVRTTTTLAGQAAADKAVETVAYAPATTDVDLDGSYSCEHTGGLDLAELLLGADAKDADDDGDAAAASGAYTVIEHCLAVSDTERRRCLLRYDAISGDLEDLLLLVETRDAEVEPAGHATLYGLCGTWRGDASIRAPGPPSAPKAARGFGFGGGGGKQKKASSSKKSSAKQPPASPESLGVGRTAVFKAQLTYAWDGERGVARQLKVTAALGGGADGGAGGGDIAPIRSMGTLRTAEGAYGEYEAVGFAGDAGRPTLLMLPAACHILAPLKLLDAPFSTEFGAVLEPGESFGWRGFQQGDDEVGPEAAAAEELDEDGMLPPLDPAGESDVPRLVRISRLYGARDRFVSGSTSLCTLG